MKKRPGLAHFNDCLLEVPVPAVVECPNTADGLIKIILK